MPPVQVYAVNFTNGNLTPYVNLKSWPNMIHGGSSSPSVLDNLADSKGWRLGAYRPDTSLTEEMASNSLYVIPPPGDLPLETRLRLRVGFDLPYAQKEYCGPLRPRDRDAAHGGEAWAVALMLKFGNEKDVYQEPYVTVTCQFNRNTNNANGIRLNTPGTLYKDKAANLVAPLDYDIFWPSWGWWPWISSFPWLPQPPGFTLELNFCGVQAGPRPNNWMTDDPLGYTVGSGLLSIAGHGQDYRAFTSAALSTGAQTSLGAVGVSIATLSGVGQIMARIRNFSVFITDPL